MRISDWSSDVCSSDLLRKLVLPIGEGRVERGEGGSADIHAEFGVEASIGRNRLRGQLVGQFIFDLAVDAVIVDLVVVRAACVGQFGVDAAIRFACHITSVIGQRSEESLVGTEWFSTFRSLRSAY